MSRNFELLKRAEQDRQGKSAIGLDTLEAPRPLRPLPSEMRRTAPPCPADAIRPGIADRTAPEINKLVQSLFVLNAIAAPRVAIFSPMVRTAKPDFIAAQVAEVLVDQNLGRVVLVDVDVFRPSLHAYFSVRNTVGFTDMLSGDEPAQSFGHRVDGCELTIVTTGRANRTWQNQLATDAMTDQFRGLRSTFDYVLISAPPISECPGIASLGQRADGVVLVIEAHDTRRDVAGRVKREWERANTRVLGAVLNNRTFPIPQGVYTRL